MTDTPSNPPRNTTLTALRAIGIAIAGTAIFVLPFWIGLGIQKGDWTFASYTALFEIFGFFWGIVTVFYLVQLAAQNPESLVGKIGQIALYPTVLIGGGALFGVFLLGAQAVFHRSVSFFLLACFSIAYVLVFWFNEKRPS